MKDNQELAEIMESLRNEGYIYNDADFCRKTGLKSSFVSEMKTGKKPFTGQTRQKVEQTFPQFFNPQSDEMGSDLAMLFRIIEEHDIRFHELANRILDSMGVHKPEKKEKTA